MIITRFRTLAAVQAVAALVGTPLPASAYWPVTSPYALTYEFNMCEDPDCPTQPQLAHISNEQWRRVRAVVDTQDAKLAAAERACERHIAYENDWPRLEDAFAKVCGDPEKRGNSDHPVGVMENYWTRAVRVLVQQIAQDNAADLAAARAGKEPPR